LRERKKKYVKKWGTNGGALGALEDFGGEENHRKVRKDASESGNFGWGWKGMHT